MPALAELQHGHLKEEYEINNDNVYTHYNNYYECFSYFYLFDLGLRLHCAASPDYVSFEWGLPPACVCVCVCVCVCKDTVKAPLTTPSRKYNPGSCMYMYMYMHILGYMPHKPDVDSVVHGGHSSQGDGLLGPAGVAVPVAVPDVAAVLPEGRGAAVLPSAAARARPGVLVLHHDAVPAVGGRPVLRECPVAVDGVVPVLAAHGAPASALCASQ